MRVRCCNESMQAPSKKLEDLFGCMIVNAAPIHPEWRSPKPRDAAGLHPGIPGIAAPVEKYRALVSASESAL